MRCQANQDYIVKRASTAHWWEEPDNFGDIVSLDCAYCEFRVLKRYTRQPRTSKSGLGRYNRMRAAMIHHLHVKHRERLDA